MADLLPFQRLQQDFAAYVRDPENVAPPHGIEPRRMAIYARLVYNNVESVLANVFGCLQEIVGKSTWRALVRDFLCRHTVESPYYSKLPDEFLAYLAMRDGGPPLPTFAGDLCHYAWVKYALPLAPDMPDDAFDDDPIALDDLVELSSLAWPLHYAFPVMDLGPDCQASSAPEQATYLIAYRNRSDEVKFMASNALTLRLLALVESGASLADSFATIAGELSRPVARIQAAGLALVNELHAQDVLVRARTPRKVWRGPHYPPGTARRASLKSGQKMKKPVVSPPPCE